MVREPVAYVQKHPIVLDGVADEKDWKYARRYGDFRAADTNAVFAPLSVKFCFASNALYVAGELMNASQNDSLTLSLRSRAARTARKFRSICSSSITGRKGSSAMRRP